MTVAVAERVEDFLGGLARSPCSADVLSVVVAGSAARGEEMWEGDHLLSDIDLMVVTRRTSPRLIRAIDAVIGDWSESGIDGGQMPLGPMRTYATLALYEARHNGVVVRGDLRLADAIPLERPEQLPLWEGVRVLANRLFEHLKLRAGLIGPERAVAKSYEALADAYLVAERRYRPSFAGRLEELEGQPPAGVAACTLERILGVLGWRLGAGRVDASPDVARGDLLDGIAALGGRYTGAQGSAAAQLALIGRREVHLRHRAYWAAVMARQGRAGKVLPHIDPVVAVWRRVVVALVAPADRGADAELLEDWRRCPQILKRSVGA